jgi:hypothetical protein
VESRLQEVSYKPWLGQIRPMEAQISHPKPMGA